MTVTLNRLLVLLALVALVIFTLMGFDVWHYDHPFGVLGLGLALWCGAAVV